MQNFSHRLLQVIIQSITSVHRPNAFHLDLSCHGRAIMSYEAGLRAIRECTGCGS